MEMRFEKCTSTLDLLNQTSYFFRQQLPPPSLCNCNVFFGYALQLLAWSNRRKPLLCLALLCSALLFVPWEAAGGYDSLKALSFNNSLMRTEIPIMPLVGFHVCLRVEQGGKLTAVVCSSDMT
ncbi:hypothetical protein SAY86_023491 [Trapa natans]|uniref:Uncharacterized protein n=1 Tax=Trapa natans TaxID=22666 RepID=A0AAN7MAI2_TRANT|nr:hypothetical protein SAY86_023491 [Trapa natans]